MIVDCHGHLVPPDLLTAIRKDAARFPTSGRSRTAERWRSPLPAASRRGRYPKPLSDIPARLAWMAKQGIDDQVVGGWVDMFGYELPGGEGEAWARLANDVLLAAAKSEPRFVPLATVPLGDGARAATVLKAAMAAGFPGAMIGTLPRGIGSTLDARRPRPVLAAADETGALIHIHPSFDAGDVRVNDFGLANGLGPHHRCRCRGRAADLQRAMSRGTKTPRFSRRWARPACPSCSGGSSATTPLRPASATRSRPGAHLYRHHPARRARAEIRRRDDGHRTPDDGLRHAVPDRRHGADEDRRRGRA